MTQQVQSDKPTSQVPVGSNIQQLYDQCQLLIKDTDYQYVTACDALAVCEQESVCSPIFEYEDPLFVVNIGAAYEGTKLPKQMIWEAVLIKKGPYSGKIAKFRYEPSYWDWAITQKCNSLQLMLQMSCSFGIAQQMMRWVTTPGKPDEWIAFIENFKADTQMQLRYLLEILDKLLKENDNNLAKAYCGYNSGNSHSEDIVVLSRAERVVNYRDRFKQQFGGIPNS
jgi:hypothetical protein